MGSWMRAGTMASAIYPASGEMPVVLLEWKQMNSQEGRGGHQLWLDSHHVPGKTTTVTKPELLLSCCLHPLV